MRRRSLPAATPPRLVQNTPEPALLVLSKLPRRGMVKTRLAARIGDDAALRLHRAFLVDTMARAQRAACTLPAHIALAWDGPPGGPEPVFPGIRILRQTAGDLGQRQAHAQGSLFASTAGAVVTIGSDSPTLPMKYVREALVALQAADLAVVPARDGGYVLVAQGRPLPDVYTGLPWGTAGLLAAFQQRARALGLRLHQLRPWHDVDDVEGLRRLRHELTENPAAAPASADALAGLPPALWRCEC